MYESNCNNIIYNRIIVITHHIFGVSFDVVIFSFILSLSLHCIIFNNNYIDVLVSRLTVVFSLINYYYYKPKVEVQGLLTCVFLFYPRKLF